MQQKGCTYLHNDLPQPLTLILVSPPVLRVEATLHYGAPFHAHSSIPTRIESRSNPALWGPIDSLPAVKLSFPLSLLLWESSLDLPLTYTSQSYFEYPF